MFVFVTMSPTAKLPTYESDGSSGADLYADGETVIYPGKAECIWTGLKVAIPHGYEIQIRTRSGLAIKNKIIVLNSPGTIDSDYRGEIGVILFNAGHEPFTVFRGMRIAQAVLQRVSQIEWIPSLKLPNTARGEGGFGSTGT